MDKIWANRLIAESKTWEEVRRAGREQSVRAELMERVKAGTLSAEKMNKLTGEEDAAEAE